MLGYIYMTTCLINNKIYIGQHISEIFEPNKYIGSGSHFKKALKKYGKDSFICELLCWADTQEDLNRLEIYYIALYNSTDTKVGYNLCKGGIGGNFGYKFTEEQINHLKEVHMGHKNTPEAIQKQADKLRGRIWIHKQDQRKMVDAIFLNSYLADGWLTGKGMKAYQSKPVVCFETNEEFESRTAATRKYHGAIKRCLHSEAWRTSSGYHWYYKGDEVRKNEIIKLLQKDTIDK